MLELQQRHLAQTMIQQAWLDPQTFELAQVELPFLAKKTADKRIGFLRAPVRPRSALSRHMQRNERAIVPANFDIGLDGPHNLQQTRQQFAVPLELLARRKALLAQVPALSGDLPRHHVFRPGVHSLELLVKRLDGRAQKRLETRRLNLAQPMDDDGDLLPWPLAIDDVDARFAAVDFDAGRVVERRNGQLAVEIVLLERVSAHAEDEPNEPFHAGVQVAEPTQALA